MHINTFPKTNQRTGTTAAGHQGCIPAKHTAQKNRDTQTMDTFGQYTKHKAWGNSHCQHTPSNETKALSSLPQRQQQSAAQHFLGGILGQVNLVEARVCSGQSVVTAIDAVD
jgi:hypothetical protein